MRNRPPRRRARTFRSQARTFQFDQNDARLRDELEKDKGGIEIAPPKISSRVVEKGISATTVVLEDFTVINKRIDRTREAPIVRTLKAPIGIRLQETFSNDEIRVKLLLDTSQIPLGDHAFVVLFKFNGFNIGRCVEINVVDEIVSQLAPTSPFVPPPSIVKQKEALIIRGIPPSNPNTPKPKVLPRYPVPKQLGKFVNEKKFAQIPYINEPLTPTNHGVRFSTLLFLEQLQMEFDIQRYNMDDAMLVRQGYFWKLQVPGLTEKRPSVVVGDSVLVTWKGSSTKKRVIKFQGYVHKVELNTVSMRFAKRFDNAYAGQPCSVEFSIPKGPLNRMQHALVGNPLSLLSSFHNCLLKCLSQHL